MSKSDLFCAIEMVRVIFEGEGRVNLALTYGSFSFDSKGFGEYYGVDVKDKDYNTMEDYLPEYLTENLALLKLAKPSSSIENVGFKNVYEGGGFGSKVKMEGKSYAFDPILFPREVFYVDINSIGFKQLVKDCKVRRSNRVK